MRLLLHSIEISLTPHQIPVQPMPSLHSQVAGTEQPGMVHQNNQWGSLIGQVPYEASKQAS
jgi:hypothetical protein